MNLRASRRLILVSLAIGLVAGCDSGTATKIVPAAPLSEADREVWKKQVLEAIEAERRQQAAEQRKDTEAAKPPAADAK